LECGTTHVGELRDQLVDQVILVIVESGIDRETRILSFHGRNLPTCARFDFLAPYGGDTSKTSV
jgi:hypothetical protein